MCRQALLPWLAIAVAAALPGKAAATTVPLPCAAGHFSLQGACVACNAGKFAATAGMTFCSACPAGRSAHRHAQTACDACSAGTVAAAKGAKHCLSCAIGRYQPVSAQTSCIECAANMYGDPAPDPTTRASAAHCTQCPDGQVRASGTDSSTCTKCAPGQFRRGSVPLCAKCVAGHYALYPGASTCASCPAGRFVGGLGATDCTDCAAGQHATASASAACVDCEAGRSTALTGETACDGCSAGKYKSNDDLDQEVLCDLCAAGRYSDDGDDACTACPEGRHAVQAGTATCAGAACAPGQFTTNVGCRACPAGKHSATPTGPACVDCAVGFFQHSTRGAEACYESTCKPGYFQDSASRDCLACPWGKHQLAPKQGACDRCPSHTVPTLSTNSAYGVCVSRQFYHRPAATQQPEHTCAHLTCELQQHHTCAHRKVWAEGSGAIAPSSGLSKLEIWSVGCNGKRSNHQLPDSELAKEQSYTSIRVFHHARENGSRHRCTAVDGGAACKCTCWTDAPPTTSTTVAPAAGAAPSANDAPMAWQSEAPAQQAQDLG
jgi:hypothetical protein